jgi:hypothetical protein
MICRNWPLNAQFDCKLVGGDKLTKFFVINDRLLKGNEDLLEKASYWEETK